MVRVDGVGRKPIAKRVNRTLARIDEVLRRRRLGTGTSVAPPFDFTLGGSAELRWSDYERGWFAFVADGGPCEDRTRSYRLSACNRALTVLGFSPGLAVVREARDGNAQLYGYRRTSGEPRFVVSVGSDRPCGGIGARGGPRIPILGLHRTGPQRPRGRCRRAW